MPKFPLLKTKVASWFEDGCAVESGEFGLRLVPSGLWGARHVSFMADQGLREIHFNRERGFTSNGEYTFLERMERRLIGFKVVDSEARDISSLQAHSEELRSLDLVFVGKLKKALEFDQFIALERLSVLVPVPHMDQIFSCTKLEKLALSRYAGHMSNDMFSNLKSLKHLFLSAMKLKELTPLQGLARLETLTVAASKGLRSLDGLEGTGKPPRFDH